MQSVHVTLTNMSNRTAGQYLVSIQLPHKGYVIFG